MDQRIINLYDEFTHGAMGRRAFLKRLAGLAGGAAAAWTLLPLLENNYARAATIAEDDPRITSSMAHWPGGISTVHGYLVQPATTGGPLPGVIVIHENRGLNPHIRDFARRVALAGFVALAPDGLSALGGTPGDEDAARALFRDLDRDASLADFTGAVEFLRAHDSTTDKVGSMGFCWGGSMSNRLAVAVPALSAAVAFYGSQPPAEDVVGIGAAIQLHYAENDERINAGAPAYAQALEAHGVQFEQYLYPGTQHAFHNDTNEARYNAEAAALAWARTVEFLRRHLH